MYKIERLPITEHGRNCDWDHRLKITDLYDNEVRYYYCTREETFVHCYRTIKIKEK